MYKIESGIPVCPPKRQRFAPVYPWRDMKPGDSIFVEKANGHANRTGGPLPGKSVPGHFVSRKVEGGWRIWRVS